MKNLIVFSIIGFLAQLIDGSLGMAYGLTSTTLLLLWGISPAIASASVHLSEIATTAVSGAAHLKFKNVDKKLAIQLIIPGSVGAFLGATFLSNLPGDLIRPYISLFLLILGIYVTIRFLFMKEFKEEKSEIRISTKHSIPLGFTAGFLDATGGGGWGPVITPILLSKKGVSARKVIGTVDTSEFAIAVSASLGFLISIGVDNINWRLVLAFMIGGVIAAPIAAWLVKIVPAQLMGVIIGGFIIVINARTLLITFLNNESLYSIILNTIVILWILAILLALYKFNKKSI